MKSRADGSEGHSADKSPVRESESSFIDVRDSWIEVTELSAVEEALSLPAVILRDREPAVDATVSTFLDEPLTLPRALVSRSLLASLDEQDLIDELATSVPEAKQQTQENAPAPFRRTTTSPPARRVEDLDLSSVEGFEDLTRETQSLLLADADEKQVGPKTDLPDPDTFLVVKGSVRVGASRGEGRRGIWNGLVVREGEVVTRRRSMVGVGNPEVLGGESGTTILVWGEEALNHVLRLCPWEEDSLREQGDRVQTVLLLAATLKRGLWTELMRLSRLTRLEGRTLSPGEELMAQGSPVRGMHMVGFGEIELLDDESRRGRRLTGELVFPACVLSSLPAPHVARAGDKGATVMVVEMGVVKAAMRELPLLQRMLQSAG